jgi:SAM-dependent methyltransferase
VVEDNRMDEQHEVWESWAQVDPLWSILSDPSKKGGRWDLDEFFASGASDVAEMLQEVSQFCGDLNRGRALDFGCGVGRLSRALAGHFDRVDGVDISETMVALAERYNTFPGRVHYHVNRRADLSLFGDDEFDLVFTTIVLQHNPPEIVRGYISEFLRILRPGAVAVFDMTVSLRGASLPPGSHQAHLEVAAPATLAPGRSAQVRVAITNVSPSDWPAASRVAVGNHWMTANGQEMVVQDDGRAPLPDGLPASGSLVVDLRVTAPNRPGSYALAVDAVEEGTCWFASAGSTVAQRPVEVRPTPWRSALQRLSRGRDTQPEPEPFAMNGLPKDEVLDTVARSGGSTLEVSPSHRGGEHWDGYRYFVQKNV